MAKESGPVQSAVMDTLQLVRYMPMAAGMGTRVFGRTLLAVSKSVPLQTIEPRLFPHVSKRELVPVRGCVVPFRLI